jgi:hypothetical protein
MPLYRVTLKEVKDREWPFNPFKVRDIFAASRVRCRVWEIEAKDEAEVRSYYDEAKRDGLENVRGYVLDSIALAPLSATARGDEALAILAEMHRLMDFQEPIAVDSTCVGDPSAMNAVFARAYALLDGVAE